MILIVIPLLLLINWTIIHVLIKISKKHAQCQHGSVNVSGEKFTTGLVYRVVDCEKSYNNKNDAMVVECMPGVNHIVKGVIGFDYVRFHKFLKTQVDNRLLQIK